MAVADLGGAAVATPVMGDAAISLRSQKDHLIFKCVGAERPTVAEDDGLPRAPVLVKDPGAVVSTVAHFGRQRWTKAVFAALFQLSLSAILQHSSRLEKRVTTERAYRLNRAPVGPARAPPL
jgi:hypothetical protein